MDTRKESNYARKIRYLNTYNRKAPKAEGAAVKARVWGFDFPEGDKPWKAGK